MTWFEKIMPSRIKTERRTRSVPEGLWIKCPACDAVLYRAELERNLQVCPKCTHHMRIGARDRLARFLDPDTQQELAVEVEPEDPLKFRDSKKYRDRLAVAQKQTGERDALVVMAGPARGPRGRRLRVRVPLPRRLDGLGGRRAIRARRRVLHRAAPSAGVLLLERRRAHAGRPAVAAADEQDQRRAGAARGSAAAVRLRADRPDHGRRVGEPRDARRPQHRRAARADRLRRVRASSSRPCARPCPRASSAASSCSSTARST